MNREVIFLFLLRIIMLRYNIVALVMSNIFLQEDFFIVLHEILAQTEDVTELQPVPDAHVPVMKFKFHGISIDLLYASVSVLVVPAVSSLLDFPHACSFIYLFGLDLSYIIIKVFSLELFV